MADPLATIAQIYRAAHRELTEETAARMQRWLEENPRAKHGAHRYQASDYGLDGARIRRDFADYTAHFAVAGEPD